MGLSDEPTPVEVYRTDVEFIGDNWEENLANVKYRMDYENMTFHQAIQYLELCENIHWRVARSGY